MRARVALAAVVLLGVIAGTVWWLKSPAPTPAPVGGAAVAPPTMPAESAEIAAPCDPVPDPPPLPATLTPSARTVDAIVQALDAALTPAHKEFLKCFPDENDLVARVHFGMGRWLRRVLQLRHESGAIPELRALGVKGADATSSVIVRAYARFLRQAPVDLPDVVARTRAVAVVPVVAP
jgi:hypothetical protein